MAGVSLLEEMTHLAAQPSDESRRALLRNLTDLFDAETPEARDHTKGLFEEVVTRVIDDVAVQIRAEVSERLSKIDQSPRNLMLRLANDDATVAAPVLRNSEVLTDHDLIRIAEMKGQDHLMAISRRKALSERVTDILVARGETQVLHSVTRNVGARFSEATFETLIERSEGDDELQSNIVERADLTEPLANRLRPFLSEMLREKLDEAQLNASDTTFHAAVSTTVRRVENKLKARQRARLEIRVIAAEIQKGERDIGPTVEALCKADRALDVASLILTLSDLHGIDATKTIFKREPGPIAVLCKNAGIPTRTFAAIVRLRRKRLKLDDAESAKEVALYEALKDSDARRAVHFLKLRNSAA
ncbi:uncharacterized protein (DUF2336 family) [Rhodobium orientis]|uniref:DUF2336 domain-containing protein n=1 Tax=Rhodobium orientis TaxID=34017 RepID=A0A327JPR5_9HYPH|nr:DUF2336 domain-containing protein [Rhodobium orientis]MBB4304852.1 uncharacterized protein (DUF2336 family) [Rhodobium orientis]MBK5949182.1 hypothetical protein [Rhodobium orientis]RAI27353.1 hypothetical protein CH339_10460 [Rhodobium orientis]